MAVSHAKDSRLLVNERHSSAYVTGFSCVHTRELGETTTIVDTGSKWIPGHLGGSLTINGLFDSAAGSLYQEAATANSGDNGLLVTVLPAGTTLGLPAFITVADLSGFTVDANVKEVVSVGIEAMPDDGVDWGVSLHAHGAETADGNGSSVDSGASSANGGVASLHVTAYSGLTSAVIKIQDSDNDSDWTDLITFTTVTAATSQRLTVSGTVEQYVRATVDVTGTGSVTYQVAFARR